MLTALLWGHPYIHGSAIAEPLFDWACAIILRNDVFSYVIHYMASYCTRHYYLLNCHLKGIQKIKSTTQPPRMCLPISLCIMQNTKCLLLLKPPLYDPVLISAACCLAFLILYESANAANQSQYDHTACLSISDKSIDNKDWPQLQISPTWVEKMNEFALWENTAILSTRWQSFRPPISISGWQDSH